MKKVYRECELNELIQLPVEVNEIIKNIISIINDSYSEDRDIDDDLGGYVVIAENIIDVESLKQDMLKGIVSEYTDIIECSEGVNWTSSLFLLSNDYSIVVVTTEELYKYLLE